MVALSDAAVFGQKFMEQYLAEGWGSLGKRDMELLLFVLLEKDGALDRGASNYTIARQLRVTESKASSLRRDAYARWRPLTLESPDQVVRRLILAALDAKRLENTAQFASERRMGEGFIPLLVEHPDDRSEIEQAIKAAGAIPIHERNREVVLIHYSTLIDIGERLGLIEKSPKKIQVELKKLLGSEATLSQFLQTPLSKLTWSDARAALNEAGAIVAKGGLQNLIPFTQLMIRGLS